MMYPTAQEVFDVAADTPPDVLAAHFIVDDIHLKHKEYIIKHKKYPPEYADDLHAAAKEHGFEFTHPKYAAGPKLVESKPTVH